VIFFFQIFLLDKVFLNQIQTMINPAQKVFGKCFLKKITEFSSFEEERKRRIFFLNFFPLQKIWNMGFVVFICSINFTESRK